MKDSGIEWIGKIPDEWELRKLKYTLKERKEKNDPIKTREILSLTVEQGVIPYSEKKGGGNKAKEDLTAYKVAYPNDIVMNSMNVLAGAVGLSNYLGAVSPVYYMYYTDSSEIDIRYYNFLFKTKQFQLSLLGLGNGILIKESGNGKLNTIRMRIPSEKLGARTFPVPTIGEQQKISDFLEKKVININHIIDDTKLSIEELKRYKQSIITEAVTKGLDKHALMRDSGIEWVGDIPSEWQVIKAKYIFHKMERPIVVQEVVTAFRDGQVIQRKKRRTEGFTNALVEAGYQGIKKGDLVIHTMDAFAGAIGVSEDDGKSTPAYVVLDAIKQDTNNKYFAYLFRAYAFTGYIESMAKGIRVRSTDFKYATISNTPLLVPDVETQNLIVSFIDKKISDIDLLIEEKENLNDYLDNYKKSMIYEYVTGKKQVL